MKQDVTRLNHILIVSLLFHDACGVERTLPLQISANPPKADVDTPEDWERAERLFAAGIVKDTVEFGD